MKVVHVDWSSCPSNLSVVLADEDIKATPFAIVLPNFHFAQNSLMVVDQSLKINLLMTFLTV
jgi:hypothetical protein